MIICNLNTIGTSVNPDKAHPPLIIDPNAVLSLTVALEGFQTIGRRNAQVRQVSGIIEHSQLASGDFLDIAWYAARYLTFPYLFSLPVAESLDHR